MSETRRRRSPNWLPSEKKHLLDLVELHFDVIENKQLDAITMKAKVAEWRIIAEEYNNRTSHYLRNGENLKNQWESMKKAARKEAAKYRKNIVKIEPGDDSTPPDPLFFREKEDPFHHRILGLIGVPTSQSHRNNNDDSQFHRNDNDDSQSHRNDNDDSQSHRNDNNDSQSHRNDNDSQSHRNDNNVKLPTYKMTKGVFRRIPTHTNISSLERLHRKEIEAIELKKRLAIEEMQRSKVLQELEIQIKREQLRQEKIKTYLLMTRQRKVLAFKKKMKSS